MNQHPPLNSLIAFDAAMRTNSFALAAKALYVTPGAIGQQIRNLEAWLGVALFIRRIRQVQPTPEALTYWKRIQPALTQIRDASNSLRHSRRVGVWLSMPPTFAAKWFTRHMADFLTRHPDTELHLNSSTALVDFEHEQVDLAIRHFDGRAPELDTTLLFPDDARVYCSPGYAQRLCLERPEDIRRGTLLNTTLHPHWTNWLSNFANLAPEQAKQIPAIHFDQALLAIDAACHNQGLVLSSRLLTTEEIAGNRLIEPFPLRLPLNTGYYLVHPKRSQLRPGAENFKIWLLEQFRENTDPDTATVSLPL